MSTNPLLIIGALGVGALVAWAATREEKEGAAAPPGAMPPPPITVPPGAIPPITITPPAGGGGVLTPPSIPGMQTPPGAPPAIANLPRLIPCSQMERNAIMAIFSNCTLNAPQFCDPVALRAGAKMLEECGFMADAAKLRQLADNADKWSA